MSFLAALKKVGEFKQKIEDLNPANRLLKKAAGGLGLEGELEEIRKLHNPQKPYGDNRKKARASTPAYRNRGKMGILSK